MLSGIGGGALEVAGFELVYVTAPGDGVRVGLADVWALRLESVPPVRRFASYRGQRHLSGCWWSATDGRHVGFESWLERDHVMALDFDPAVGAIASQPFWLFWPAAEGGGLFGGGVQVFEGGRVQVMKGGHDVSNSQWFDRVGGPA